MAIVGFVGAMVGIERSVLPLVAGADFGLASVAAATSFIVAFGPSKALANLFAGRLSERIGRRSVLLAGWLVGLPVPFLVIAAPSWAWIVAANMLLGINQGLCWSMTVNMKADLAGRPRRGLVIGLNEASGYVGVGLAAFAAGVVGDRLGLRPEPFYLMIAIALAGTALSLLTRDTAGHVAIESGGRAVAVAPPSLTRAFTAGTWRRRDLSAFSLAGLITNLTDGVAWGIVPLALAAGGLPVGDIAVVAALYPISWGLLQVVTGSASDRFGRLPLIVAGLLVQGLAVALFAAGGFGPAMLAAVLLGFGTALAYPTLIAAVADAVAPVERATAIGVYRFWRDNGTLVGALGAALIADALGFEAAFLVSGLVAGLTALVVAVAGRRQSA